MSHPQLVAFEIDRIVRPQRTQTHIALVVVRCIGEMIVAVDRNDLAATKAGWSLAHRANDFVAPAFVLHEGLLALWARSHAYLSQSFRHCGLNVCHGVGHRAI